MQTHKETEELNRDRLLSGFLASVKVCQVRYGGRTELATESDPRIATLCQCLEETLVHGLKMKIANRGIGAIRQVTDLVSSGLNLHLTLGNSEPEKPVLWWYVREILTKHEFDRFLLLRNVTTDEGRGRAWLRSLLNEHSLERYIHIMLSDQEFLEHCYEPWALLRDQERAAMLPNLAAGLDSILFAINIDNDAFNVGARSPPGGMKDPLESQKQFEPEPHIAQVVENVPSSTGNGNSHKKLETKRKKKKIPSQLVSFDEDVLTKSSQFPSNSSSGCFSAPTTSINSPTAISSELCQSQFSQLIADEDIKMAKKKLEFAIKERSKPTSLPTSSISSSSKPPCTLPLSRESSSINRYVGEPSYNQVLEDLMASEASHSSSTNSLFEKKSVDKFRTEQETLSFKSFHSNISGDSLHCCEEVAGMPSLIPIEGDTGGLFPLSPEGEVLFNVGNAHDDATSLKSSSQDEFDISECMLPLDDVERKEMSNSASIGSLVSGGSVPSSASKCSTVTASSFSSLTFDELRTAVLEISRTRDACEQKRAALATALNTEMETSSTLRAQLTQEQSNHKESVDRLTSKVNALTRENELLRHQLKKYIGAVQMLRRDNEGGVGEDNLVAPPSKLPPEIRDYHDEAAAYEGKLIQVAEMHGELMEFNERLQRLLKFREIQVQRLREELVELRGPFPTADDDDDFDETLSVTSDLDSISAPRTLINIWIPTAFLAGPSSDTHHVYQIYVRIKDDEWNVYRRFAQFYELHKRFKKRDSAIRTFDFPQKKTFGNKDMSVVEDRRIRLQQYLRQLVNFLVSSNPELASQPSKATLTNLLPFLLDSTPPKETSKTQSKRRFLSRLSSRQEAAPAQSSPQYNGL